MSDQSASSPAVPPKILIVDDDTTVLAALERLLSSDFSVLTAKSGEEALQILPLHKDLAVVLTDQRMPGLSGLELLGEVMRLVPDAVRALLSGAIDISEMVGAINSTHIHRFILKPWDNTYLRLQMMEALSNHQLLREKRILAELSITDPVTHLANHRHFHDRLKIEAERAVRHSRSLSLIIADIDSFKSFNDQFGHPVGDLLLKAVADRLVTELRSVDLVARFGGEEFAILLPDTSLDLAFATAERIRTSFVRHAIPGPNGRPIFVTISQGISAAPHHATSPNDLIAVADRALYQAKRQGRNQTVVA